MKSNKTVDEYLKIFEEESLKKLLEMREILKTTLKKNKKIKGLELKEEIKYGIPTFVLYNAKKSKNICHYGGFKNHIGFFPGPKVIKTFESDLKKYVTSKGSIQFPLDQKLPKNLIGKITKVALDNMV